MEFLVELRKRDSIRVERIDDTFNHSRLNNYGVELSRGFFVALLNNDVEVLHPDWLSEMVRGFDVSAPKQLRFLAEVDYMKSKWGDILQRDPFYNPNLSLDENLFALAFPPGTIEPWQKSCGLTVCD